MIESKMTNVLISTEKFIATLTFPVKNKISEPISKKESRVIESTDAVVEVTPVMHTATKEKLEKSMAHRFYTLLTFTKDLIHTKNKQAFIQQFITDADEKVRHELMHLDEVFNLFNEIHPDRCLINLLDKSGKAIVHSWICTAKDLEAALHALHMRMHFQPATKKLPPIFVIPLEAERVPKPRQKEKTKGNKERRHVTTVARK